MRKYEAATLDFYDDRGILLRELIEDPKDIPDFVKTAEAVDQNAHSELFALVLHEDGHLFKKFATADAGNTFLSTLYFSQTFDRLPEEAQKIAAVNLVQACEAFDIGVPDFLLDLLGEAEVGPIGSNIVDVSGRSPPMQKVAHEDEPVEYAVVRPNGEKFYPLRDASSVKLASDFFAENHMRMVPKERRQFAVKVASLAKKGALPVSEPIKKYAGTDYGALVEGHLTTRYLHLVDAGANPTVTGVLTKLANLRSKLEPEDFAAVLEQFDIDQGLDALWDRGVADPWYSTFANEKRAEAALSVGFITRDELQKLAQRADQLHPFFQEEVITAFRDDPVVVFESMPLPMKQLIGRISEGTLSAG